jgi:hypothetical protein
MVEGTATTKKEPSMPALTDHAPIGAPCWIDLMTSDPARSREFYGQLFGWVAEEPNEQFGGYFNFVRNGALVAGCMSSQPDAGVTDVWSVYLSTDDARKAVESAAANAGQVLVGPADVGDLGTMAVVSDPGGAAIGLWRPGLHRGFGVLGEPGAPAWFELLTRDYEASVDFYRTVFHWDTQVASDSPDFRYTTLGNGEEQRAGIMDAANFLPEGVPAHWSVYFQVADTDAALAKISDLGGSTLIAAEDTPYGRMGTAADPSGAVFKVITGT